MIAEEDIKMANDSYKPGQPASVSQFRTEGTGDIFPRYII